MPPRGAWVGGWMGRWRGVGGDGGGQKCISSCFVISLQQAEPSSPQRAGLTARMWQLPAPPPRPPFPHKNTASTGNLLRCPCHFGCSTVSCCVFLAHCCHIGTAACDMSTSTCKRKQACMLVPTPQPHPHAHLHPRNLRTARNPPPTHPPYAHRHDPCMRRSPPHVRRRPTMS